MATALTPTTIGHKALVALGTPPAADTTGNTVANSGDKSFLYIENGSTIRQITVAFGRVIDGDATITSRVISVPANFKGFLKLGPVADYGNIVSVTANNAEVLIKAFELS